MDSGDTSILYHAFISIFIALWAVTILCHNTYACSLLFYKVYTKRENAAAGILGWKRSKYQRPILHNSKSPKTPRKLFLEIIKNTQQRKDQRGPHPGHKGGGAPYPLGAPPASWATWQPSGSHLLLYEVFYPGKNHKKAYGTKLPCHEAEPWRNQSRAPAELFCRGNFPSGGGNHHHRFSHWEGVNLHQHLHQHHILSNPSSSLVSNLCIQTSDWPVGCQQC